MNIIWCNVGKTLSWVSLKDGATTLIKDGVVTLSVPEDRLTRKKHAGGFEAGIESAFDFLWQDPDKIVISSLGESGKAPKEDFPEVRELMGKYPELAGKIVMMESHHLAHAYSVFPFSGFSESLIVVADMEWSVIWPRTHSDHWKNSLERVSYFLGRRDENGVHIELVGREFDEPDVVWPGEAYWMFTHFLWFKSYVNSWKTMGLAPYWDDRFSWMRLYGRSSDGKPICKIPNVYHGTEKEITRFFADHGHSIHPVRWSIEEEHMAVARFIQKETERVISEGIRRIRKKFGIRTGNVCLSGGVALNCVMNSGILEDGTAQNLYVQPACGDTGQSLWAAAYWHYKDDFPRTRKHAELPSAYLGPPYQSSRIEKALEASWYVAETPDNPLSVAARKLCEGKILWWFQGRSELGPRALGNRSILANPCLPGMKDLLNSKVKHREEFRPFAPVCTEEDARAFFEISAPTPYMLLAPKVRPEFRKIFPAITHVDGTARLQTVSKEQNPKLHALLREFERLSWYPVLINTSLNDGGDPLVETPEDAMECFGKTGLDLLVIENYFVSKR